MTACRVTGTTVGKNVASTVMIYLTQLQWAAPDGTNVAATETIEIEASEPAEAAKILKGRLSSPGGLAAHYVSAAARASYPNLSDLAVSPFAVEKGNKKRVNVTFHSFDTSAGIGQVPDGEWQVATVKVRLDVLRGDMGDFEVAVKQVVGSGYSEAQFEVSGPPFAAQPAFVSALRDFIRGSEAGLFKVGTGGGLTLENVSIEVPKSVVVYLDFPDGSERTPGGW
jgi:hypothetical protein